MVDRLRYAIASSKHANNLKNSRQNPYRKTKNIPHTYILDSNLIRSYAASTIAESQKLVQKEERKKDLRIIDFLQSEQRGDELALFAEEIKEEAESEARQKQELKRLAYAKNLTTAERKKQIKKIKEKTLKDRFKLKDFDKWFKFGVGYSTSLSTLTKRKISREYLKASIMVSPIKYFFFGGTFNKDINSFKNIYYQPDFSYSFGYSDWHPDTWSLIYANYADNKFDPIADQDRFNTNEGTWELKYKTKLDKKYNVSGALQYVPKLKQGKLAFTASRMLENDILLSSNLKFYLYTNQQQLTLSGKTFLYKKFFVSGSIYLYSDLNKQTDLEPDYAYSFGWVDTKKWGVSVVFSNYYTPTRWGWRETDGPTFDQGSLSISINF